MSGDISPIPSAAEQCRELVERFEREYPEEAALLDELRRLNETIDEFEDIERDSAPQPSTWSAPSTSGQWAVPQQQRYDPDPAATMQLCQFDPEARKGWPLWVVFVAWLVPSVAFWVCPLALR